MIRVLALILVLLAAVPCLAQLPQMEAVAPEVKPAVEQITYDSWFLKTLVMRADNDLCNVRMIFCRYNYAAKKMSPSQADEVAVEVDNAYEKAGQYGIWQQAMGGIVVCAAKVIQEKEWLDRLADVDSRIAACGEEVPAALAQEKVEIQSGLALVLESMDPIEKD